MNQPQTLIAMQRETFAKAERFHYSALYLQLGVGFLSIVSIFAHGEAALYLLAVLACLLTAVWRGISVRGKSLRHHADAVRRAALIMQGLGQQISTDEMRDFLSVGKLPNKEGVTSANEYYSSDSTPGPVRLGEMLEESAFFSEHLFVHSAQLYIAFAIPFVAVSILTIVLAIAVAHANSDIVLKVARTTSAALALFMSADIIESTFQYFTAAAALRLLRSRLRVVRSEGFPIFGVLMIMGDYNSIVEGAPMMAQGVMTRYNARLSELWRLAD